MNVDLIMPRICHRDFYVSSYFDKTIRVTVKSPKTYRKAVFKIAEFFRREFGYDFVQYGHDGNETDATHVAFLWLYPDHYKGNQPCIGAACFRYREYEDQKRCWAMQWVWIHPYHRRQGLLTKAWPEFEKEFGDFVLERPLSVAMKQFVEKRKRLQGGLNVGNVQGN